MNVVQKVWRDKICVLHAVAPIRHSGKAQWREVSQGALVGRNAEGWYESEPTLKWRRDSFLHVTEWWWSIKSRGVNSDVII